MRASFTLLGAPTYKAYSIEKWGFAPALAAACQWRHEAMAQAKGERFLTLFPTWGHLYALALATLAEQGADYLATPARESEVGRLAEAIRTA